MRFRAHSAKSLSFRAAMASSLLPMAGANIAANRWPGSGAGIGLGLTGTLGAVAGGSGLDLARLGLARTTWPTGLRWGGACAVASLAGYAVALTIPAARAVVAGSADRGTHPLPASLGLIAVATVIPEEFAFRGVLWALLHRQSGQLVATAISSLLFGIWHVLPALSGGPANEAIDAVVGDGPARVAARVGGTVLFTVVAGVLFGELRARSGSLLAPMVAHWAVNAGGVVFVQVAGRFRRPESATVEATLPSPARPRRQLNRALVMPFARRPVSSPRAIRPIVQEDAPAASDASLASFSRSSLLTSRSLAVTLSARSIAAWTRAPMSAMATTTNPA